MPRLNLHYRLFVSHLSVLLLGLLSFAAISNLSSAHLFSRHLDRLENDGFSIQEARIDLVQGFDWAWNYSTLLALTVGIIIAALLSYWIASRINHSLVEIEQAAYRLANGHLSERVPTSEIPELARLGRSLNQMVGALEDAEARRREIVTDLSHELRTPLTVIRGYLEEMDSDRIQPTPDIRKRLLGETKRLQRLVNNLQDLSKAESGSLPISLRTLLLPPLLDELTERFETQIMDEGPVLRLDCPADLPKVWADSDRTEQILVNLLGNAIRHTQQGTITLKAWSAGERVWMAVTDTGCGLSASELPRVFERFWRSEAARSQHRSGTGIGLTITRQLVELQGGEIFVESQLDRGTTFQFWLPKSSRA
ncbi:MAG: HAMP domain-containing sensor histidine kinase [Phormidesmis sp.]